MKRSRQSLSSKDDDEDGTSPATHVTAAGGSAPGASLDRAATRKERNRLSAAASRARQAARLQELELLVVKLQRR
jgi:hypothetical protein